MIFWVLWRLESNVAIRDIVDSKQTTVSLMPGSTLFAAAEVTNVLVVVPHVFAAHRALTSLEEDAAASDAIAPAVS